MSSLLASLATLLCSSLGCATQSGRIIPSRRISFVIPRISRDPDNDRVIASAVVGEADVIVSGDEDLLVLERAGGIPILTATQFLEMLHQGS